MTEREKMIEIMLDAEITGIKIRNIIGGISMANAIADALIAAGIGDVKEAEHRAARAERALLNFCKDNLQIPSLFMAAIKKQDYLEQAEKELAELKGGER